MKIVVILTVDVVNAHICFKRALEADRMKGQRKDHNVFKALALISQLGIGMLVPVFIGLFFGRFLDRMLGTGWLTIVFLILGVLAAYRNLYYYTKPLIKGEKEKENEALYGKDGNKTEK